MRNRWNSLVGGLAVLLVVSGPAPGRDGSGPFDTHINTDISDSLTTEEPDAKLSGFPPEQRERLKQLKAWLRQRNLERQQYGGTHPGTGAAPGHFGFGRPYPIDPFPSAFDSIEPPRQSGVRTLRIGRGSDGRIQHRYVFEEQPVGGLEPAGANSGVDNQQPADPDVGDAAPEAKPVKHRRGRGYRHSRSRSGNKHAAKTHRRRGRR